MKIDSYAVNAGAARTYQKFEAQTVQVGVGGSGATGNGGAAVRMTLSAAAQQLVQAHSQTRQVGGQEASAAGLVSEGRVIPRSPEELKLSMLEEMLTSVTGRRTSMRIMDIAAARKGRFGGRVIGFGNFSRASAGVELRAQSVKYECEAVAYKAQGIVNTADGKRISVDVSMSMSREFYSYASASMELRVPGRLMDPLIINYGGSAASLTNEKYAFDLTMDGFDEQISFAGPGSGFLVLDKNGDGIINDGGELFGPSTGQGFEELRAYDSDGNGWIDENDDIFKHLQVWSKDANGGDQLYSLLEVNVGAIYLGDVSTRFDMNGAGNENLGVMRSTSFFLKESGGAGTLSHIDLRV